MQAHELLKTITSLESTDKFFIMLDAAKNHTYVKRQLGKLPRVEAKQIGNLFEGAIDETSPLEVSPLLVALTSDNYERLQSKLLVEDNFGMFSIIQTAPSRQELILHLQPFLQAELPTGEFALFRFYDPTIVKILDKFLETKNFVQLVAPFENWWYQNKDGNFNNLIGDVHGH